MAQCPLNTHLTETIDLEAETYYIHAEKSTTRNKPFQFFYFVQFVFIAIFFVFCVFIYFLSDFSLSICNPAAINSCITLCVLSSLAFFFIVLSFHYKCPTKLLSFCMLKNLTMSSSDHFKTCRFAISLFCNFRYITFLTRTFWQYKLANVL